MPILPQRGRGRPHTNSPEIRVTVISNDYQLPFVDWSVYATFKHFLADIKPDFHFINGDFLDLYPVSKYDKDPEMLDLARTEIETANTVLDELYAASPSTITKFVYGNHCERLTKRMMQDTELWRYLLPEQKRPDDIIADLLSLKDRSIDYVPYRSHFNHYGFIVTHGQATGLHPAKRELERYGKSGCSGHVNRQTYYETKNQHGYSAWWTLGGLTSHKLDFMPINNWTHGIGVLYQVVGSDRFSFYPIEIVGAKFIFDGKLYTCDGVFKASKGGS